MAFKVGDVVFVKKGLVKDIEDGIVSNEFSYVEGDMCQLADDRVKLIIRRVIHEEDTENLAYMMENCQKGFCYNEAWLEPADELTIIRNESTKH